MFLMQILFAFLGTDDFDHLDAFNIKWLSKQALTGFLMMFGWAGITCLKEFHLSSAGALLAAFTVGVLTLYSTSFLFKNAKKLQSPGSVFNIDEAIGKEAVVYQRIPKNGIGKITISLQQMTFEINAAAHHQNEIPSFTRVKVINKIDDNTIIVAEIK